MKKSISISIRLLVGITLLLVLFSTANKFYEKNTVASNLRCVAEMNNVRVSMGDHKFKLPKSNNFLYIGKNGKSVKKYFKGGCQKAGDPPYEVTEFSFLPVKLHEIYSDPRVFKETHIGFSLQVGAKYYAGSSSDTYTKHVISALKQRNIELSNLPKKNDYYVLSHSKYPKSKYYIASSDLLTPSGNPVVFYCEPSGDYETCSTTIHWKDGVNFYFRSLSSAHVSQEYWKKFYITFFNYMTRLELQHTEGE